MSVTQGRVSEVEVWLPNGAMLRVTVVSGPKMTIDEAAGVTTALGDWWRSLGAERVQDGPPDPSAAVRR